MAMPRSLGAADLHFGQDAIIQYRTQFRTVEEHDKFVLTSILNNVTKRDTLWLLGDLVFKRNRLPYLQIIADAVHSLKIVLGNHDCERDGITLHDYLAITPDIYSLKKYRGKVWFSHAPMHESSLRGGINIHGHEHNKVIDDPRYVCISLEQTNYIPVDLTALAKQTLAECGL